MKCSFCQMIPEAGRHGGLGIYAGEVKKGMLVLKKAEKTIRRIAEGLCERHFVSVKFYGLGWL